MSTAANPAANPAAQPPTLVAVSPGAHHGATFTLPGAGHITVGRDPLVDVVLADATVSRRHAQLQWNGSELWIDDLHSTGGTYVNSRPVLSPQRLSDGDLIEFAAVQLRYSSGAAGAQPTQMMAAVPQATPPPGAAHYDVGSQSAGMINNVGQNQYLSYVQQVQTERNSFLRDVAATRTKARIFVWIGVAIAIVGFAAYGRMVILLAQAIWDTLAQGFSDPNSRPSMPDLGAILDEKIFGISSGFVGFGLFGVGVVMMSIGIVLHIVATSRRKRVDRELPIPAPPWTSIPQGKP